MRVTFINFGRANSAMVIGMRFVLLAYFLIASVEYTHQLEWDERGYVLYCPCMGKDRSLTLRSYNQSVRYKGA